MHLAVVSTGGLEPWTSGLAAALSGDPATGVDVVVLDDRPPADGVGLVRTAELLVVLVGGECGQLASAHAIYDAAYALRHLTVVVLVVDEARGDGATWLSALAAEHPTFRVPSGTAPADAAAGLAVVVRRTLAERRRCLGPAPEPPSPGMSAPAVPLPGVGGPANGGRSGGRPPAFVPRPRPVPASELEALVHLERVKADEQWNQAVQAWSVGLWEAMAQHLWQLLGTRPLDAEARLWLARVLAASQRRSAIADAVGLADGAARIADSWAAAPTGDAAAPTGPFAGDLPGQLPGDLAGDLAKPAAERAATAGGSPAADEAAWERGRPSPAVARPGGVPQSPRDRPEPGTAGTEPASGRGGDEPPVRGPDVGRWPSGAEAVSGEPPGEPPRPGPSADRQRDDGDRRAAWAAEAWLWVARLARQLDPAGAAHAASRAATLAPARADVRLELAVQNLLAGDPPAALRHAVAAYQLDDAALAALADEPALTGAPVGADAVGASVAEAAARAVGTLAALLPAAPNAPPYPPVNELARWPLPALAAEGRRLVGEVHRALSADAWGLADDAGLLATGLVAAGPAAPVASAVADAGHGPTLGGGAVRSLLVRGPTVLGGGGVAVVALVLCGIGAAWVFGSILWVLPGLALAGLAALLTLQAAVEQEGEQIGAGGAPATVATSSAEDATVASGQGAAASAPAAAAGRTSSPASRAAAHEPVTRTRASEGGAPAGPATEAGERGDLASRCDDLRQRIDAYEDVVATWPAWAPPVVPVGVASVGDLVLLASDTMPYDVAVDPALFPPGLRTGPEEVSPAPRLHRIVARDQAMRFAARSATYFPWPA